MNINASDANLPAEELDVSVIRLSNWAHENRKLRLDSSYFSKSALQAVKAISGFPLEKLGDLACEFRKGIFDIKAETYSNAGQGVPFLRIGDLKGGLVNKKGTAWIPWEVHEDELKTRLFHGDIVLAKTAYPMACFVNVPECNVSQDLIAVRLSDSARERYTAAYIVAFLNSRFGLPLMAREFQGNVQQHLSLEDGKKLRIPRIEFGFQRIIDQCFRNADAAFDVAEALFKEVDQMLVHAMESDKADSQQPLTYVTSFAELSSAARLDPQYYMPTKASARAHLERGRGQPLGTLVTAVRDIFDPSTVADGARVRNYDVTDALQPLLDNNKEAVPAQSLGSVKKVFQDGDVVISRLRAYLQEIAVVRKIDALPSVGSSEFVVLRPKDPDAAIIAPETLLAFLRSEAVQTILRWSQDGSQHPRFRESDLLSIHVPDAVIELSPTIERKIQEALHSRKQASELLARAQAAIEAQMEGKKSDALRIVRDIVV